MQRSRSKSCSGQRSVQLAWVTVACMLAIAALTACKQREPEPVRVPAVPAGGPIVAAPAAPAAAVSPAQRPPSAAQAPVAPPPVIEPPPGWSKRLLTDEVPLCVFADERERGKALFIEQVKPQTLRAGSSITFGVFPPGCLNRACDDVPLLQCWVEREGDDLTVHSRFASFHKEGSSCSTECLEVDSACTTPELPAGKYTVRYGDLRYQLRVPSTLRTPCVKRK